LNRFRRDSGVIVVATIAFGMGIDRPDVRFVAHIDLPKSLEAYYQETGRAGRDGLPAVAWMVHGPGDVPQLRRYIDDSDAGELQKRIEHGKLDALISFSEASGCRRQVLLRHFGETLAQPCGNCDLCLEPDRSTDVTEVARKALSAVYRTGQRFGVGHLVDVLRGADTEKVRSFGHQSLKTFGVGRDRAKGEWQSVFRQLVAAGYLVPDAEGHGGLMLTEAARPVLRGEKRVEMRRDPEASVRRSLAGAGAGAGAGGRRGTVDRPPEDDRLWHALRAKRLDLARTEGLPPYVIVHDSTLLEMVRQRPRTPGALARVPGVGGRKLERYGEAFLGVILAEGTGGVSRG
ncbi:MAG: RQC domain-containing protein, partial [Rhodospirillales bacterium]